MSFSTQTLSAVKPKTAYFVELFENLEACKVTNLLGDEIPLNEGIEDTTGYFRDVKRAGGKIVLIGNGGSAAIVSHMQNDLCKSNDIRAMSLTESSSLTAWTNDEGYEEAFAQQVSLWGESRDLLVAVSSSGSSENILRAVGQARKKQMLIVTFSGFSPENNLRQLGDLNFYISSNLYGTVECSHSILSHYITDLLKGAV